MVAALLDLPWMDILAGVWQLTRHLWQGLADEGMYEVLAYESTLELKDAAGQKAEFPETRTGTLSAEQHHCLSGPCLG